METNKPEFMVIEAGDKADTPPPITQHDEAQNVVHRAAIRTRAELETSATLSERFRAWLGRKF